MSDETTGAVSEKSFLIVDCGHDTTTAALFDVVAGRYRLLARADTPTTIQEPWRDVSRGIQHAIAKITAITGRKLLSDNGRLIKPMRQDGTGVDLFTAVFSAAPPLRTFLVGLFEDVSLESARRAMAASYTTEIGSFSLADTKSEGELLSTFVQARADVVFIVGGTDGGAKDRLMEQVALVSLGLELMQDGHKPHVIFAGNQEVREMVTQRLGEQTAVQIADNVRPTLDVEHLDDAVDLVGKMYRMLKINTLPGMRDVQEWSNIPILSATQAFASVVEYLAALHDDRVIGVDIGSSTVAIVQAEAGSSLLSVKSDLGMGRPIVNILEHVSPEQIGRWLPFEMSDADLVDFVRNKALHPYTIPMTEEDLYLEQAVARELLRHVVLNGSGPTELASRCGFLVARGGVLAGAPRSGQAALILLDALQPTGIFPIGLDLYGVLPALGATTATEPMLSVQALEGGALSHLGWVIAPSGNGAVGKKALMIEMESAGGKKLDVEVAFGALELLPLAPGEEATLKIKPTRRFDVGMGPGKSTTVTLQGGALGVVVDLRGRPLELASRGVERNQLVEKWLQDVGGS